jgi:hypothetical protein
MRTLEHVYDPDNLARAWRWIRSNPDAGYKNFFRSLYLNYSVADAAQLDDLRDRLQRAVYEPAPACKVFQPKRSGLLRPITLLTVEDQITYQAMVNVVAERLHPKVKHRYGKEVFGHLLAGKASVWFYRKWQTSYAHFNAAARRAFKEGFVYSAHFDLTAFYDSLDHGVLCHFLTGLRCDKDFLELLARCLNTWTSTQGSIFHNHGIPQGPLSSGLLSEVVLQHFDQNHRAPPSVRYFRYVDDIRLFSTSLADLRRVVTWLDMLSKDIGLFPQSSKIEPHEVTDIEAELKAVSQPFDQVLDDEDHGIDQDKLCHRLMQLSKNLKVNTTTEFKFLLAFAKPSARLNARLWRLLDNHPEISGNILRYFQLYSELPDKSGDALVRALEARPRYPSVIAELLRTADGRLKPRQLAAVDEFVDACLADGALQGADYLAATMKWGIRRDLLTRRAIPAVLRKLPAWWAQGEIIAAIHKDCLSDQAKSSLLNEYLKAKVSDVAIAAAIHIVNEKVPVTAKATEMQRSAACVLESFGVIRRGAVRVCGVRRFFNALLGGQSHEIDWKKLFGRRYRRVEQQAVWCRAFAQTDITAWVNAMDVFNDFLLDALCKHDPLLPKYTLGGIGGILSCARLKTAYPALAALIAEIHEKRAKSALSHPVKTHGKTRTVVGATGRIRFSYINRATRLVRAAVNELAGMKKW